MTVLGKSERTFGSRQGREPNKTKKEESNLPTTRSTFNFPLLRYRQIEKEKKTTTKNRVTYKIKQIKDATMKTALTTYAYRNYNY